MDTVAGTIETDPVTFAPICKLPQQNLFYTEKDPIKFYHHYYADAVNFLSDCILGIQSLSRIPENLYPRVVTLFAHPGLALSHTDLLIVKIARNLKNKQGNPFSLGLERKPGVLVDQEMFEPVFPDTKREEGDNSYSATPVIELNGEASEEVEIVDLPPPSSEGKRIDFAEHQQLVKLIEKRSKEESPEEFNRFPVHLGATTVSESGRICKLQWKRLVNSIQNRNLPETWPCHDPITAEQYDLIQRILALNSYWCLGQQNHYPADSLETLKVYWKQRAGLPVDIEVEKPGKVRKKRASSSLQKIKTTPKRKSVLPGSMSDFDLHRELVDKIKEIIANKNRVNWRNCKREMGYGKTFDARKRFIGLITPIAGGSYPRSWKLDGDKPYSKDAQRYKKLIHDVLILKPHWPPKSKRVHADRWTRKIVDFEAIKKEVREILQD